MRWALLLSCLLWTSGATAETVRVFAAASLKTALDAAAVAWTEGSVTLSYAGSGAVARQVAAGAPADIVILAHTDWMDWLADQGALAAAPVVLAGNTLVVIGPQGAAPLPLTPAAFAARLGPEGRLAMGDLRAVPAGLYGREALEALGLWDGVAARVAQADNVRGAMAFVARAEAPLGIVYGSDATAEPRVRIVAELPAESHTPILYPAALTRDARTEAAGFLAFLQAPGGQHLLRAHGLREPPQ
jgi:molybdate transport system substrate-binding protein